MSSEAPKLQLLSPGTVGGRTLRSREVLAPLARVRGTRTADPFDHLCATPKDLLVEHYSQRTSAGPIATEAAAISEMGAGWRNAPHIRTPGQVDGWRKVTLLSAEPKSLPELECLDLLWNQKCGRVSATSSEARCRS
uniref:NADH:flavin oxidoreductase/NADH oxidase N-terminal domain-containing protein n=1 Tax=Corethron hystrix TaxID=216773 RepID=A0A7S1BA60_9STRA|mmetsp:Transcript_19033/g.43341  ORF Transcript_19033/g.43341 Transcript_19033/m.43341 type:complete len:137 (+) Transcript_19033:440-850(+)